MIAQISEALYGGTYFFSTAKKSLIVTCVYITKSQS
jgi:hypothetical protein